MTGSGGPELGDSHADIRKRAKAPVAAPQGEDHPCVATGAPPCVNQIEVSPFLYRKECVDYFQSKGLVVQAFKPLQRGAALGNETNASLRNFK